MSEIEKTTPGPWRAERSVILDANGGVVAECFWAHGDDTAALIVKAVNGFSDLESTLQEIVKQAVQADDPEHHTLSLTKHMALRALSEEARSSLGEVTE
jgi:hypothetical protein